MKPSDLLSRRFAVLPRRATGSAALRDRVLRPGCSLRVEFRRCRRSRTVRHHVLASLAGSSMTPLQLVALLDALLDRDESDTYRLTRDLRSAVRHPTPDTGELTPAFRQHRLQMLRVL